MNIKLVCSAGMSTSLLVKKMRQYAKVQNISTQIEAVSEAEYTSHLKGTDVILIGPQIRYLENSIRTFVQPLGIKVAVIDSVAYGLMQGDKVLQQAIQLMKEN